MDIKIFCNLIFTKLVLKKSSFVNKIFSIILIGMTSLSLFMITGSCHGPSRHELVKVLIISGRNNHEWTKTTPVLMRMFKDSELFLPQITEIPDTLNYDDLKRFDLIVSNWNTWPDNDLRWSDKWESDFSMYVKKGGGTLFLHAGASSFYGWDAYHRIGIGRWGKDTKHGMPTIGRIYGFDQTHPVTKGMQDFYIMDELWENTDIHQEATVIGSLSGTDVSDAHSIDEPAIFINQTGKGRSFYTILGHDERALLNSALQSLLLRAAQWCANREVTIALPAEINKIENRKGDQFNWTETDSTLTLSNHSDIVWQLNYNNRFGKPYFHPLKVNNIILTCVSPPDHSWHLGLWFSWKYINSVNYWEYLSDFSSPETGFKSEGVTDLIKKEVKRNPDFSSVIRMKLIYHPISREAVLDEERILYVSTPFNDGSYYIDEEHLFSALADSVILDRTPITGEPDGQSWGGYAGVSARFNQDFTSPEIFSPADSTSCPKCSWLYMGFNSLTGKKAGISILQHPEFTTRSSVWYVIRDPGIPFWYYSPAALYDNKIILKKGEILHLKYRIWALPGATTKQKLQEKYDLYLKDIRMTE